MVSLLRSIPRRLRSLGEPYRSLLPRWPLEGTAGVVTSPRGMLRPTTHLDINDPVVRQRLLRSRSGRRGVMVSREQLIKDLKKALAEAQEHYRTQEAQEIARLLTAALKQE